MAWVGINTSGIAYALQFAPLLSGSLAFVGNVLTATDAEFDNEAATFGFTILFDPPEPRRFRITFQSFATDGENAEVSTNSGVVMSQSDSEMDPSTYEAEGPEEQFTFISPDMEGEPQAVSFQLLVEVDVVERCRELGRVTRAYVSAYTRERIHQSRLFPQERRCLIANFNGALPPGRTIAQAQWDIEAPYAVAISDAFIAEDGNFAGRETGVTLQSVWKGDQVLRCQVTMDNGEIYTQLFYIQCLWRGWFGDQMPAAGPSRLVVTA